MGRAHDYNLRDQIVTVAYCNVGRRVKGATGDTQIQVALDTRREIRTAHAVRISMFSATK